MRSPIDLRGEFAQRKAQAGTLDLKTPDRLRRRQQSAIVAASSAGMRLQREVGLALLDQLDAIGGDRQRADAQQIDLDQAQLLDALQIELRDQQALRGILQRDEIRDRARAR